MTLPQHKNPREDRKAIAPYNFVPLPENVLYLQDAADLEHSELPCLDTYHTERHTGWLECELTTATPLYVRCGLTPEQVKDKKEAKDLPEFFTAPDTLEPLIPGSSLRGMLRNLVEIVSYSKVQPVTQEPLIYRAVGDTSSLGESYRNRLMQEIGHNTYTFKMQAGYMRKQGTQWQIVPAKSLGGAAFARVERNDIPRHLPSWHTIRNASKAYVALDPIRDHSHNRGRVSLRYVKVSRIEPHPASSLEEVVVVQTGWMGRKHQEFVFGLPDQTKTITIPDVMVEAYKEQVTDAQEKFLGSKQGALQDWQPVFYIVEKGDLAFFGHAMMFRLPYQNSAQDFIPESLRRTAQTDLAEALFGYVEDAPSGARPVARAGRVSVTDAQWETGQDRKWYTPENQAITPKILATPKPTTFQHYLVQPEPDDKRTLKHYASATPDETVIRGHKLYWHKRNLHREDWEETPNNIKENDTQHTQIKPVAEGVRFNFRIHFEDLDNRELGVLLWILNLAADEGYRLKLGMGKPLGLGSVKVTHTLHLVDREARYACLFAGDSWGLGEKDTEARATIEEEAIQAFEKWILQDATLNPGKATSLSEVPRIQQLSFLLSWPGRDKEESRYLEIQHPQNGPEYRDRKVLPMPDVVMGQPVAQSAPSRRRDSMSAVTQPRAQSAPSPQRSKRPKPVRQQPRPEFVIPEIPDEPSALAQSILAQINDETVATSEESASPIESLSQPVSSPELGEVKHPQTVAEISKGDLLELAVASVDADRVTFELDVAATGTMGLERLDTLVRTHPYFTGLYDYLDRPTAADVYAEGGLDEDLQIAPMVVQVRDIEQRHGKTLIKLDFVKWLYEA